MNIFKNDTKALPKKDEQIIRIPFEEQQLGARSGHMPGNVKSGALGISHVPNAGGKN